MANQSQSDSSKPKLLGLLFTITSGVSLGLLLAIFFLLTRPVAQMASEPSESYDTPAQYIVPYIKGKVAGNESLELKKNLRRMENRMPGDLALSEKDVNWLLGEWFGAAEEEGAEVESGNPNLRMKADGMVFSLPVTVSPATNNSFTLVLQVGSRFEESDDGPLFVADSLYLNCLRLPAIGLGSMIREKFAAIELPPKLQEGLSLVSLVKHQESGLVLSIGE